MVVQHDIAVQWGSVIQKPLLITLCLRPFANKGSLFLRGVAYFSDLIEGEGSFDLNDLWMFLYIWAVRRFICNKDYADLYRWHVPKSSFSIKQQYNFSYWNALPPFYPKSYSMLPSLDICKVICSDMSTQELEAEEASDMFILLDNTWNQRKKLETDAKAKSCTTDAGKWNETAFPTLGR